MEYVMNNKPIVLSDINNNNNNNIIFNCFDNLREHVDINYYYNIFKKLNDIDKNNLINYINMKWCKMKILIKDNFKENNLYLNLNIQKYNNNNNNLNSILNNFIKSNKILSLFVINCIHRFFY